jgi:pyruvate dehydrogenase complex dehydrogenase (E1) component
VIFGLEHRFEIGKGYVLREGTDVTIISTGVQTTRALEAVDLLAGEGVSAHLLHLPTLKPIDEQAIVEAAARTGAVVTAEDHTIIGGLGGAVAEVLGEQRPTPMRRVGVRDVFGESGPNDALLEKYGLTARNVAAAARICWQGAASCGRALLAAPAFRPQPPMLYGRLKPSLHPDSPSTLGAPTLLSHLRPRQSHHLARPEHHVVNA